MTTEKCCRRCGSTAEPVQVTCQEKPPPEPYRGYFGKRKTYWKNPNPKRKVSIREIIAAAKRFERDGSAEDLDNAYKLRKIAAERIPA